ncbi:hypothetical protein, partial [Mesorhizobium sp. M2A.F.Ca.ET.017.03.2.1]|uniref:hypothetical protein n=1 Tax=Mesorhizobium sp. M2A.F.Ca.ET.017.03.2.1 TaxID=2496650 RepID=UPI001AEC98C9
MTTAKGSTYAKPLRLNPMRPMSYFRQLYHASSPPLPSRRRALKLSKSELEIQPALLDLLAVIEPPFE